MSDFYIEDIDRLPFTTSVELFRQELPQYTAVCLAAWFRFRKVIGLSPQPLYASRWDPDADWQQRDMMPAKALSRWAPHLERLEDSGFSTCGWHRSETIGAKEEANVFLLDETGSTLASLMWLTIRDIEQTQLSLTSYRQDGTEIMTAALPPGQQMLASLMVPDYVDLVYVDENTAQRKQLRLHQERLTAENPIQFTPLSLPPYYRQQRIRLFQYARDKGFVRPATDREVKFLSGRS